MRAKSPQKEKEKETVRTHTSLKKPHLSGLKNYLWRKMFLKKSLLNLLQRLQHRS